MPSARSNVLPSINIPRADIQALRAIAVVSVVLYHFWPEHLTGGFIGVDVFFVISGFLITGHLLRAPIGGWNGLVIFWGRRIRRLLPAAFLVLAVTLLATWVWAPITLWQATAEQAGASALYVQNWFLANEAIDYMAADNAPTAVQHFWSLSIEEQFYLVWPVIIAVTAFFSVKSRRFAARHLTFLVIAVIAVVSLAMSVYLTDTNPAGAYFITWGRAWELALGGLAACAYPAIHKALMRFPHAKSLLAWAGIALIAYAALTFDATTVFPGIAALIPVAGTALVLLANPERAWGSPLRLMQWRPVQFAGDISYSLYLWHWPFVTLLPFALARDATAVEKAFAIVNVICIAYLTKKFVEDRYRGSKPLGLPLRRTFIFAITGMLAIALAATALTSVATAKQEQARADVVAQITGGDPCFGALALENPDTCEPHGDTLITDPIFAKTDTPAVYTDGCWFLKSPSEQKPCVYGSKDPSAKRVALVGDSHAGHWLPALQTIA
ncbi:MAG: acyltransferase family protein, partial [Cryobacterium sp.]